MDELDPEIVTQLVFWLLVAAACVTAADIVINAIRRLMGK